jgi:hypothetical protein
MDLDWTTRKLFAVFVIVAVFWGIVLGYLDNMSDSNVALAEAYATLAMITAGIAVGLLSLGAKDPLPFLLGATALVVSGTTFIWGPFQLINPVIRICAIWALNLVVAFAIPIAIIEAVKTVLSVTING